MSVLFMSLFVLVLVFLLVLVFHVFRKKKNKPFQRFSSSFLFIVSHVFHLQKRTINNKKKKNEAI